MPLAGAFLLEPDAHADDRGLYAVVWDRDQAERLGIDMTFDEGGTAWNAEAMTLRGMHYQTEPDAQAKLVRCTSGSIFDVIIDLRPGSSTRLAWYGTLLSANDRRSLYVPRGFAHGYLTLERASEVEYLFSGAYRPTSASGIRWDDPAIGITWPDQPSRIATRDASYPFIGADVGR
jgi:dTDP-4-dehydrorhamnose 3,5-epimerase